MPAGRSPTRTADSGFFALGSGPGRAVAVVEDLYGELGYKDSATQTALVLEAAGGPPASVIAKVAEATGLAPEQLTFIYAPTQSLAGSTQVVARVLEVALHKAHTVGFDLHKIVDGIGSAPLSPPAPGLHQGHGPHQRRDHLRRPRAALRGGRRRPMPSSSPSRSRRRTRPTTARPSPRSSPG